MAGENFPVASLLLPRRVRQHLLAVYAFARLVDDVGDEVSGDRVRMLDLIEADLDRVYGGGPRLPVMRDLASTIKVCGVPAEPFRRLIQANRQDQAVVRYDRFGGLLGYCELSANPVGHIVLHIFGVATPERMRLSDKVCTALQLVEHWQDVSEDLERGRVYLPLEDLARFDCTESDLVASRAGPNVRRLMAFETRRAARLLDEGAPLVRTLGGFARLATAGYVAGGRAAIASIVERDHDVLSATPHPDKSRVAREWLRLLVVGR
ncbi:MAG: squalene synthase HpnC [Streptosporangiaceae bacterium]